MLVARHRQPLLFTGNVFVLIFVARLGMTFAWSDLVGAAMVAGLVVLALGAIGASKWLARLLPAPIVFGLLAGAVLPFVVDMFTALGRSPVLVGVALTTWVVVPRLVEPRVPAILLALVATPTVAAGTGSPGSLDTGLRLPSLALTAPTFAATALASATPVLVALIVVQANIPSAVYLRSQGYTPPERTIDAVSGIGTVVGSLLGLTAISLPLPATALCAGPEAGPPQRRNRAAWIAASGALVIGVVAALAPDVLDAIPDDAIAAIVGLAVIGVLALSLRQAMSGPRVLGPVTAFTVAQSDLTWLDLGPFFWALVSGVLVTHLLARETSGDPAAEDRECSSTTDAPTPA